MPELPEVETIRRGLEPLLTGIPITALEIRDGRLVRQLPDPALASVADGTVVASVGRRGKYLLISLDDGTTLIHHLRMTGAFKPGPDPDATHVRAIYHLANDTAVLYRDVRRFGTLERVATDILDAWLDKRLGPEPLGAGFTSTWLMPRLARRSSPVKTALLDQRLFCGVGNIYADEALFAAGINPLHPADELDDTQVAALVTAVTNALETGIALQGSTLRDYSQVDGSSGSMQDEFTVYGRAGMQCLHCTETIIDTRVGGRTTAYCPACQPVR